jgi:hypothetical protein
VTTVLTNDPLLRDQLVSRIAAVYGSAAAAAVSSRSNYNSDTRAAAHVSAGSDGPDTRSNTTSRGSTSSDFRRDPTLHATTSQTGNRDVGMLGGVNNRSSSTALRCNDFIGEWRQTMENRLVAVTDC